MRRPILLIALLACATGLLLAPTGATAAKRKRASKPQVTSVSPMRVKAGRTLSIRGRDFSSSRRRNTVIFAVGRRSVFVKPRRSSRRRLVIRVPVSLERLMRRRAGALTPTRFTVQVAAGRKFSRRTSRRLSPVVVPVSSGAITVPGPTGGSGGTGGTGGSGGGTVVPPEPPDCDNDGTPDSSDTSSDVDLLSDGFERGIGTDPCDADTDGDSVEDGYEFQSSMDLNHYPSTPPLPYPGTRPYPNALDPTDGSTDYDGDSLTLRSEFLLWLRFSADNVRRSGRPGTLSNLLYSDGLQESINPPPAAPAGPLQNWNFDIDGNGTLSDDERDGDGDNLANWDEQSGRFTEAWWVLKHDGENDLKESKYPGIDFLDNEDTPLKDAFADEDVDGDGVRDGSDDYDHDGLSNQFEIRRPDNWYVQAWGGVGPPWSPGANSWAYVQPFNPCKPFNSERCHRHPPFGYYKEDEAPPIGPDPPGGYPGGGPATPNG